MKSVLTDAAAIEAILEAQGYAVKHTCASCVHFSVTADTSGTPIMLCGVSPAFNVPVDKGGTCEHHGLRPGS